jgi:hypothetical protein
MAYRNHPTRYLIVKDRVASSAVAGGQQEAATYAALIPASSTFFQNPPTRLSATAFRFPEAEGVSTRPRPARQALFSNHRFARLATRPRCRFSQRGGSFYASPRGPSTLFSLAPKNRCPSVRVAGFRQRGGACLRSPVRPVNAFFQSRPRFLRPPVGPGAVSRSGRGCLRGARAGVNGFLGRDCAFPRAPPRRPSAKHLPLRTNPLRLCIFYKPLISSAWMSGPGLARSLREAPLAVRQQQAHPTDWLERGPSLFRQPRR